jgi:hypothetical protein
MPFFREDGRRKAFRMALINKARRSTFRCSKVLHLDNDSIDGDFS